MICGRALDICTNIPGTKGRILFLGRNLKEGKIIARVVEPNGMKSLLLWSCTFFVLVGQIE